MSEFYSIIQEIGPDLHGLSRLIHDNPELGYKEFLASDKLASFLEKLGYPVDRKFLGFETAFRTVAGHGEPHCLFLSEYDALPKLGHGCGHNLIAVSGVAAFHAAARYAEVHGIPGTFTLIGTPAEEIQGGKIAMAEKGAFEGQDLALILHPFAGTATDPGWMSVEKFTVEFHGKSAHAAAKPEDGLNALDAAVLLYNSVAMWRQQLPEAARVHGIITNGGVSANIIPEYSEMFWYLRAPDRKNTEKMMERFRKMTEAAAEATGTKSVIRPKSSYQATVFNEPLNLEYAKLWKKDFGAEIRIGNGTEGRASTDFGDLSQKMPGASFLFDVTNGKDHPLHTEELREDAAGDYAFENTLKASSVTAETAVRFASDQAFREAVKADWEKRTGGTTRRIQQ